MTKIKYTTGDTVKIVGVPGEGSYVGSLRDTTVKLGMIGTVKSVEYVNWVPLHYYGVYIEDVEYLRYFSGRNLQKV